VKLVGLRLSGVEPVSVRASAGQCRSISDAECCVKVSPSATCVSAAVIFNVKRISLSGVCSNI
jgi:hypothetical protein